MIFPSTILHNSGARLTLDDKFLLLGFRQKISPTEVQLLLEQTSVRLEEPVLTQEQNGVQIRRKVNHTNRLYWVHSKDGKSILEDRLEILRRQLQNESLWIGPVLRYPPTRANPKGHPVCALPHVLLVKPKTKGVIGDLDQALAALGLQYQGGISRYLNGLKLYSIPVSSNEHVLPPSAAHDLQVKLRDDKYKDLVATTYMDYMPLFVPTASPTSDPMFAQQWNLTKIQAESGWAHAGWTINVNPFPAGAGVRVAIIDDGIQLDHPDLSAGINQDLAATFYTEGVAGPNPEIGQANGKHGGSAQGNSHGTRCAGVLAARCNNKNPQNTYEGITGLAGACEILSLKLDGNIVSTFIAAVNYAAANNSDVISYSNADQSLSDPNVKVALGNAYSQGIVICAASGNLDVSQVDYPAAYKQCVIACGATSRSMDEKRCKGVWRNTTGPGSNYGDALSVVAPGIDIPTCNPGNGYISNFEGTSAATPQVAALAALLISRYSFFKGNPDLVRGIIERSADKVGIVTVEDMTRYPGKVVGDPLPYLPIAADPSKTWNWETGYGRINVLEAMRRASLVKVHRLVGEFVTQRQGLVFVVKQPPKRPIKPPPKRPPPIPPE